MLFERGPPPPPIRPSQNNQKINKHIQKINRNWFGALLLDFLWFLFIKEYKRNQ